MPLVTLLGTLSALAITPSLSTRHPYARIGRFEGQTPTMKYGLAIVLLFGAILGYSGLVMFLENRTERCAYVPLLGGDRLGPIEYGQARPSGADGVLLPPGWSAAAKGVQIGDFAIEPGTHSLQLIGIANYVETPTVSVQPGAAYCFVGQAIADGASATRLQVAFRWLSRD